MCLRIDDLLPGFANEIDFIKIDVEGAEPLAMRGARQTISANPQLNIIIEWSPGQVQAAGVDFADFVNDLGFMRLRPAEIGPSGVEEMLLEGLINLGYKAGILLRSSK